MFINFFPDAPVFEPLFSPAGVQTVVTERAPAGKMHTQIYGALNLLQIAV